MQRFSLFFLSLFFVTVFAQQPTEPADMIYFHNGKNVYAIVEQMNEYDIVVRYPNEKLTERFGKNAISHIRYSSGREAEVSPRVPVYTENDWSNVILLEDRDAALSLRRVKEIESKTASISFRSSSNAKLVTTERIKREAAKLGCPFILMLMDETNVNSRVSSVQSNKNIYAHETSKSDHIHVNTSASVVEGQNTQTIKRGVAYCY